NLSPIASEGSYRLCGFGSGQAAPSRFDPHLLGVESDVEAPGIRQNFAEDWIGLLLEAQPLEQQAIAALRLQAHEYVGELFVFPQRILIASKSFQRARVEQARLVGPEPGIDTTHPLEHLSGLLKGVIVHVRA